MSVDRDAFDLWLSLGLKQCYDQPQSSPDELLALIEAGWPHD